VTIKARLALAFVVLLLVAVVVIGFAVVRTTRNSLVDQIDERLVAQAARGPDDLPVEQPPTEETAGEEAPFRSTADIVVSADGRLRRELPAGFLDDPEPLPELPPVESAAFLDLVDRLVTLRAEEGDTDYRVLTRQLPRGDYYRILAAPLTEVDDAVSDLVRTSLVTAAIVVVLGAGLAWWIVRRGLRPVDRMVDTASAIAGGDLSQRIDHRDDGTELGRLATALDEMLTQLEAAFAEREASQAQLEQFVADASHELRTPVAAVRGYAELYRRGGIPDAEALEKAMGRIESESERMGHLVDDLLLLARLDQQQALDRAPVDLAQLARDAVSDARAVDPDREVTLDGDESVIVDGDDRRLRQVFANLLANVRVHTPPGTAVHVSVGLDNGMAEVRVADEGPGIATGHQRRIFERFYRADKSRSRASGGAGLGLSIVAGVVAAHGGTVDASAVTGGSGAVFTVRLPRTHPRADPAAGRAAPGLHKPSGRTLPPIPGSSEVRRPSSPSAGGRPSSPTTERKERT
jgi:two-component system OmpR family sensor kinase